MKRIPVIYDGDMGGDDLWAITLMLADPDVFDVKGITVVFGNVDVNQATKNVCDLLAYLGREDIPVYVGADMPIKGRRMFGDDAYGEGGVGGVFFPENNKKPEALSATDFIKETLRDTDKPITLIGTGPMTNLAIIVRDHPELHDKIKEIIVMGGAIKPGPFPNTPHRVGNITKAAEFNFFQDSFAPNIVAQSGVKLVVMTADANQQYALTQDVKDRFSAIGTFGEMMIKMTSAVEHLDREKFGMDGPAMHDPCVILYLLQQAGHGIYYASAKNQGFTTTEEPENWEQNGAFILNDQKMNTWIVTETINIPAVIDTLYAAIKSFS
jgi:pyrimidine-specific ribonucleoside hydrolase